MHLFLPKVVTTYILQRTIFGKGGGNLANKIDPRGPFLATNILGRTSFAVTVELQIIV